MDEAKRHVDTRNCSSGDQIKQVEYQTAVTCTGRELSSNPWFQYWSPAGQQTMRRAFKRPAIIRGAGAASSCLTPQGLKLIILVRQNPHASLGYRRNVPTFKLYLFYMAAYFSRRNYYCLRGGYYLFMLYHYLDNLYLLVLKQDFTKQSSKNFFQYNETSMVSRCGKKNPSVCTSSYETPLM